MNNDLLNQIDNAKYAISEYTGLHKMWICSFDVLVDDTNTPHSVSKTVLSHLSAEDSHTVLIAQQPDRYKQTVTVVPLAKVSEYQDYYGERIIYTHNHAGSGND